MVIAAKETGTDRIELYTEGYARQYATGNKQVAIEPYITAAKKANELGLGINAGHDLDLHNLKYFSQNIPGPSRSFHWPCINLRCVVFWIGKCGSVI